MTHLKICLGAKILHKICRNPSLVAIGFVVKVYHVALREQLRGISAVVSDGINVREGLHSKFAVETAAKRVKDLVFLLRTVPDIPLVHVSNCGVRGLQSIPPWRTWMVRYVWTLSCDNL